MDGNILDHGKLLKALPSLSSRFASFPSLSVATISSAISVALAESAIERDSANSVFCLARRQTRLRRCPPRLSDGRCPACIDKVDQLLSGYLCRSLQGRKANSPSARYHHFSRRKLAGAEGFEPSPSSLTVRCPTSWTTPQRREASAPGGPEQLNFAAVEAATSKLE
jgi:hypothetical protein